MKLSILSHTLDGFAKNKNIVFLVKQTLLPLLQSISEEKQPKLDGVFLSLHKDIYDSQVIKAIKKEMSEQHEFECHWHISQYHSKGSVHGCLLLHKSLSKDVVVSSQILSHEGPNNSILFTLKKTNEPILGLASCHFPRKIDKPDDVNQQKRALIDVFNKLRQMGSTYGIIAGNLNFRQSTKNENIDTFNVVYDMKEIQNYILDIKPSQDTYTCPIESVKQNDVKYSSSAPKGVCNRVILWSQNEKQCQFLSSKTVKDTRISGSSKNKSQHLPLIVHVSTPKT